MNTAWIFIKKDKFKKKQRVELYGSLTQLWDSEKSLFKDLVPSLAMFRKLIKYKFTNGRFHIEKKNVKRSKHRI